MIVIKEEGSRPIKLWVGDKIVPLNLNPLGPDTEIDFDTEGPKNEAVLDEIPGAYKDIDQVMHNQKDLVEILYTLKQVINVKGQ